MKPKTRDHLIAAMNRTAARGTEDGKDLHTSVTEVMGFLANLQKILARFESPERMREDLDKMDEPSPAVLALIEGTVRHGPALIHRWIKLRTTLGLKALRNPSTGRPLAIPFEQRKAVCDEISRLERKGLSHGAAKKRVAKQYDVDAQTIRRIWEKRADYEDAGSEVTLDQALDFVNAMANDKTDLVPFR